MDRSDDPREQSLDPAPAVACPMSGRRPRWLQYSLRTFVVAAFVLALGIAAAWKEYVQPYQHERQLEALVVQLGGIVSTEAVGPEWLQNVWGPGKTNAVTRIDLVPELSPFELWKEWPERRLTSLMLYRMGRARALQSLDLQYTQFAEDDLKWLGSSHTLEQLDLAHTSVTDYGVEHLAGLSNLRSLRLQGTAVTDASLHTLAALPNLRLLVLHQTGVTSEGIDEFRGKRADVKVACIDVQLVGLQPEAMAEGWPEALPEGWQHDVRFPNHQFAELTVTNRGPESVYLDQLDTSAVLYRLSNAGFGRLYVNLFGICFRGVELAPRCERRMLVAIPAGAKDALPIRCGPYVHDGSGKAFVDDPFEEGVYVFSDEFSIPIERP
jgi:hypothetical protein